MKSKLHPKQATVFNDLFVRKNCRNSVVVASRGFGKSHLAATTAVKALDELIKLTLTQRHLRIPNKNVYIIAPTYNQVIKIYYPLLAYYFGLEEKATRASRDEGVFEFEDISLQLWSYEAIERMRGTGCYYVVLDEPSSWSKGIGLKEAWESIIQPCIETRWSEKRSRIYGANPGRSLTIGTPKGFNYFYDMFNFAESNKDWRSYHFDYTQTPLLDPEEVERLKDNIDPIKFEREYKASFKDSGNNVFYCFDRKINVDSQIEYFRNEEKFKEDVHVAIDFNVGLQCTSAWAIRGKQAFGIEEFKGHPDTETLANVLKAKYIDKGHKVIAYPDPSGRSKKTSAAVGRTDFTILSNAGISCLAKNSAPPIVDSVAAVNRMLKTANGGVNARIHPRCKGLIESFEKTVWVENNPDLAIIDKSKGVEHYSDGARYFFDFVFPIPNSSGITKRGFAF